MGTYELDSQGQVFDDRAPGGGAHQLLQYWISEIRRSDDSATLATGRVASHFVGADYLETVGQVNLRWKTLSERGDPLLAFRWIVVDTHEWFQQSPDQIQFVLREAKIDGFKLVADEFGIMVWQRTR